MKKRIISALAAAVLTFSVFATSVSAVVTYEPESTKILCQSAYMVNMDKDVPVYKKNENEVLCPASLTKIMTVLLALEAIPDKAELESRTVVCSADILANPLWQIASLGGFLAGEEVRILDLLYSVMLYSACEGADILADYIGREFYGGGIPEFVDKMNEKAAELGCENTRFANSHGLHNDQQYTTAYDMYLITKYALQNPLFKEISTSTDWTMPATNKRDQYVIPHTNEMLSVWRGGDYYYEPVKGIKTGTTEENTQNLVTMAEADGSTYMLVVLGGRDRDEEGNRLHETYKDTKNLYKWAFKTLEWQTVLEKGNAAAGAEVPVNLAISKNYVIAVPNEDVSLLMPNNIDPTAIQYLPKTEESIDAPVKKGQVVGELELKLKDETLATVDLVASENIDRSTLLYIFSEIKNFFSQIYVKIAGIAIVVLMLVYIVFAVIYNHRRKKAGYRPSGKRRH